MLLDALPPFRENFLAREPNIPFEDIVVLWVSKGLCDGDEVDGMTNDGILVAGRGGFLLVYFPGSCF